MILIKFILIKIMTPFLPSIAYIPSTGRILLKFDDPYQIYLDNDNDTFLSSNQELSRITRVP